MNLEGLKSNWESLAERDALFAILTDHRRAGGKWDVAEFMATGEAETNTVMGHLASIRYRPNSAGSALDFGCGVGRVTQAMARRFASCVGVDISRQMIDKAKALNQYAHCRYLVSSEERLPFADARFSFIYSNIVLQHVPRRFSTAYLREFVRILAPGGILVFGVQDSFAAPDVSSLLLRVRHVLRIRSRIKAALGVGSGDMQMHCLPERVVRKALGSCRIVDIQFTNTAAKDYNGELVYLQQAPTSGYVGKQYCVRREPFGLPGRRPIVRKPGYVIPFDPGARAKH
jgi:SAM-dependent methyltransferase